MPFEIPLSGMQAASKDLEVVANNIANVATVGFKGSNTQFSAVYSQAGGSQSATLAGSGVRLTNIAQQFGAGAITQTGSAYDFAINGSGFFTLRDSAGYSYTRAGSFHPDANGNVVNATGQRVQIFATAASGGPDSGSLSDLVLPARSSPASASTRAGVAANLSANAAPPVSAPFDPANDKTYSSQSTFQVYDSLGTAHSANIYYVKDATAQNTWQVHIAVDGASVGAPQTLGFSAGGALVSPTGGKLVFGGVVPNPGAAPANLVVDVSKVTQFGDSFSTSAITSDGHAAGDFSSIDVAVDGTVSARYANGVTAPLGHLAVATFANDQGLRQLNDTDWTPSVDSGGPVYANTDSGETGSVQAGALEASNTADLTDQLVKMIEVQRSFQVNAQALHVDDQMLQTIIDTKS